MRWLPWFCCLLCACADRPAGPARTGSAGTAREIGAPGCPLAASCPEAVTGLDLALCISDASAFHVIADDQGEVTAVEVDEEAVASLQLAPGRWWGIFGDASGDCSRAVTVLVPVEEPDAL